jgi:hypothetical protein
MEVVMSWGSTRESKLREARMAAEDEDRMAEAQAAAKDYDRERGGETQVGRALVEAVFGSSPHS